MSDTKDQRDEWRRRAEAAEERLRLAADVLVATGYFAADEVGPDLAPRIIELLGARREDLGGGGGDVTAPDYAALRAVAEDYGDWFRAALEQVRAWEDEASPRSEAVLADDEGTDT